MKIPGQKLRALIRYFGTNTDPKLLGKKKLMKLFYFADFGHVKKYASPITYDNYVHLEHGPIPSMIMNLVDMVEVNPEDSILGDTLRIETRNDSRMKRIAVMRDFNDLDKEYLSKTELEILNDICQKFRSATGKNIEDASHKEAAWLKTRELESIPYTLAVDDTDCIVEKEDIETLLNISS